MSEPTPHDAHLLRQIGNDWTIMGHTGSQRLHPPGTPGRAPKTPLTRLMNAGLIEVRTVSISPWGGRSGSQPETRVEARRCDE